jgi:uncharacterized spore protein YtfJ
MDQMLKNTGSSDLTLQAAEGLEAKGVFGVERLAAVIGQSAKASAVFGEPVHQGSSVIIPVARAIWGVGGGNGPAGNGNGGGMHVSPVGFIHIEQGRARFHPLRKSVLSFGGIAALAGALMIVGRQLRLMSRDRQAHSNTMPPPAANGKTNSR